MQKLVGAKNGAKILEETISKSRKWSQNPWRNNFQISKMEPKSLKKQYFDLKTFPTMGAIESTSMIWFYKFIIFINL